MRDDFEVGSEDSDMQLEDVLCCTCTKIDFRPFDGALCYLMQTVSGRISESEQIKAWVLSEDRPGKWIVHELKTSAVPFWAAIRALEVGLKQLCGGDDLMVVQSTRMRVISKHWLADGLELPVPPDAAFSYDGIYGFSEQLDAHCRDLVQQYLMPRRPIPVQ
jgi:hypothetical protein